MKRFYSLLLVALCIATALTLSSCEIVQGIIGGGTADPCANGHSFSEEWSKNDNKHWHSATCEHTDEVADEAEHTYKDGECICGAKEPVAPHEHTYSDEWSYDETKHWHAATCEHTDEVADEAEHTYEDGECICGAKEPVAPHEHTYSDEWSYDETKHWHAATCEHTDEVADEAEHTYEDGMCICGAKEPVAPHEHTYSDEWSYDEDKHWHASTCGHDVKADEAEHTLGEDYKCTECDFVHKHTYSDTYSYNENGHWHASTCGHDVKADEAEHTLGEDYKCTECDFVHEHTYSEAWSKDDRWHWHAATCGHTDAVADKQGHIYYDGVCFCGAIKEGLSHQHTYSDEWSYDETKHWHASTCGHDVKADEAEHTLGEDYKCTECGFVHEHTFSAAWSYDESSHWHAATCGHDVKGDLSEHFLGGDDACVGNCGYKYEAPHVHSYATKWSKDATHHWHAATCEHEDEVSGYGEHTYGDDDVCDVCGCIRPIVVTDINSGGWGYSDKKSYSSSKPRIGTRELIFVKAGTVIRYDPKEFAIYIDLPTTLTSNSSTAAADGSTRAGWFYTPGEYVVQADAYLGITIAWPDLTTAIKPSQYNCDITIFPGTGEVERTYEKVNVYRFGGEGNDWCFVYLPEGYDPDRAEPYPFVIANHGNGWNMDGSLKKANWTDNTMYMSAAEIATQKVSKQGRFIATDDESLWYSNPTIEALLAAGYIVCGAQNYGDNLYGNDNCTNAVVDFFNHMVETYNVEDSCHMIGASNGAMTTLNAAEKLGEKVKSMIIQYPLASIITHYLAGGHRDNIEAAYGLDTDKTYTKAELEAVLADYDVLYKNVVNGVKQGYYPALKVYYSMTDTLTTAKANALPVIELLQSSGKEVVGVQVDADGTDRQHGDAAHFDPEAYIEWFEAH